MGTIYKRGKTYWIKYYRNGKPSYESAGSTKWADAANLLKQREGQIAQGRAPSIRKTRFEDLKEIFLRDRRMRYGEKSEKDAIKRLKHVEPFFGGMKAIKWNNQDMIYLTVPGCIVATYPRRHFSMNIKYIIHWFNPFTQN